MIVNFNKKSFKKINTKGRISKKSIAAGAMSIVLLLSGCNKTILDTKYGFDKALIFGDDTAIVLDIKQWKDYEGEQIQLITENNFALLTSSFDTNCFYGDSDNYSINKVAHNAVQSNRVYSLTDDDNKSTKFNYDIIDTKWSFNKSITFNDNNALILPIGVWKDYKGEQLQVITPDGLCVLLSSYNSKLVYDSKSETKALDFAKKYVGNSGNVLDLASAYESNPVFNYDLIDTVYSYNKAIIFKDKAAIIVPISSWKDYEGEQLQIKIADGPTIVTAAYDTILINDTKSAIKAFDIANALCKDGKITDIAKDYNQVGSFNKTILDFDYGFSNAVTSNANSSSALNIKKWCDYEGEQLQIILDSGDVLLSSSMLLDLINGGTTTLNTSKLATSYVDENGKTIDKTGGNISQSSFNKTIIDLNQKFKYALKVVDGNVTILPLKKWQDFYPDDENETNCEQFQLILPDGTVLVTTAYDTILVDNKTDIMEMAELFRSENGVISDMREYVGDTTTSNWNFSLIDTKYKFEYAILTNGSTAQVFPISKWLDFSEGEQLQLKFDDNSGFLTSFVNTTLVEPKTDGIEDVLANAFSGNLNNTKGTVNIYQK